MVVPMDSRKGNDEDHLMERMDKDNVRRTRDAANMAPSKADTMDEESLVVPSPHGLQERQRQGRPLMWHPVKSAPWTTHWSG